MTREEVREIAKNEADRLVKLLPTIDPVIQPEVYSQMLANIQTLGWLVPPEASELVIGGTINTDKIPAHPVDSVSPFPEPSTEEYTAPVMETPEPDPEPEKTYAREDVRAALAKARKKGINVTEFLAEFGVENFTGLPAAKYPEVMAKLEAL